MKKSLDKIISKIKNIIKHIYLRNPIHVFKVKKAQDEYLNSHFCDSYGSVIIFFSPGFDSVSGGIMSIISIASETKKIFKKSDTGIFVCTIPYHPQIIKYTKFENDQILLNYKEIISRYKNARRIIIHIPEIYIGYAAYKSKTLFGQIDCNITFNILLQNIDAAPNPKDVNKLKSYGQVTITTAHKAYSGKKTEQRYGCKVRHLSAWVNSAGYTYKKHDEKRNLIVVSPDSNKSKDIVLSKIKSKLPKFEFQIIENMSYKEYLSKISIAKFSLTFGEGLDGYFTEPVLSGGIGSAIYNERFFDEAYEDLPFVYKSWDELIEKFASDVLEIEDNKYKYDRIHQNQLKIISKNYGHEIFVENLITYYNEFFPKY